MTRLFLCVLCAAFIVAGCGEKADEEKAIEEKIAQETGREADVDLSKEGVKVSGETEGGQYTVAMGESAEIPPDFPDDVFIYQPSKTVAAMNIPEGYSVTLKSENDVPTVTETYKQEMKAKGWSEESSTDMGGQSVLVYKKENSTANIMIAPFEGETRITLTVGTE